MLSLGPIDWNHTSIQAFRASLLANLREPDASRIARHTAVFRIRMIRAGCWTASCFSNDESGWGNVDAR